jgi:DisA bacterial checkpoint controller nucleotide-binding
VLFAKAETEQGRNDALHHWRWRREKLFLMAKALAGLSRVDGCVVLHQNLAVLGFGGEIRVDEIKASSAPRSLRNLKSGEITPEEELLSFGTRHRSAFRLCKVHPGTVVFVISQDGDLRIFCSTDHDVYGFQFLHAWVRQSDII